MTTEEAIRILEFMKSEMLLSFDHDRKEALSLAISALQAQDVPDKNVGDMISRRDAIDVAFDIFPDDEYFREQFVKGIEALPSAQPESCEGCIQYGLWENEIEYGYPSPCTRCKRRANDNYER